MEEESQKEEKVHPTEEENKDEPAGTEDAGSQSDAKAEEEAAEACNEEEHAVEEVKGAEEEEKCHEEDTAKEQESGEQAETEDNRTEEEKRLASRIEVFLRYDAERIRLRKLHLIAEPIIEIIKQRKEIVDDYKELHDPGRKNRKLGLDPPSAAGLEELKSKFHIEKVTRRYKFVLPRVEKKLKTALIQCKQENGDDFLWKGNRAFGKG